MDYRAVLSLLAVTAAAGALAAPAYAQTPECPECTLDDLREEASGILMEQIPVFIEVDDSYAIGDIMTVSGMVSHPDPTFPVIIRIINPLNSVIGVAQLDPAMIRDDGSFEASFNTANWKYDGTYVVYANHGSADYRELAVVTGGIDFRPAAPEPSAECGSGELDVGGYCVPYTITGGTVTGASINGRDMSIVIMIDTADGGVLTLSPDASVQDGIFMVLVDGEDSNEAEIDGNEIRVEFPPGAEVIEVIGTFVIPEFGVIAVLVLAAAVVAVVAVTSRSRQAIMPRL